MVAAAVVVWNVFMRRWVGKESMELNGGGLSDDAVLSGWQIVKSFMSARKITNQRSMNFRARVYVCTFGCVYWALMRMFAKKKSTTRLYCIRCKIII